MELSRHHAGILALSDPTAHFEPTDWLRFVQLDPFAKKWCQLDLTDDDLRRLELAILVAGESHPVIRGAGGLRKLRFAPEAVNRGKRAAFRVCYCLFPDHGIVLLAAVYGKNEKSDLTPRDRAAIAQLIKAIHEALDRGTIR